MSKKWQFIITYLHEIISYLYESYRTGMLQKSNKLELES